MLLASTVFFCYGIGITACVLPEERRTVTTNCPVLERWAPEDQKKVAEELRRLGRGSASQAAVGQLIRMRDQTRKCKS